jgi:hypothetical protein
VTSSDASAKSFTPPAYSVSRKGGNSVLLIKETLWKNNRNVVKDVPIISPYVNFIMALIIVSEKKIGGITSVPPLIILSFDAV